MRKIWRKLKRIIFILLPCFAFLLIPNTAHAYELGSAVSIPISSASHYTPLSSAPTIVNGGTHVMLDYPHGFPYKIYLNTSPYSIPARSIISITYRVALYGNQTTNFNGITCEGACVVLDSSISVDDDAIDGHLLIYTSSDTSNITLTTAFPVDSSIVYSFLNPISYALVPYSSGSGDSVDLLTVENYLRGIDANIVISADRLAEIIDLLQSNDGNLSDVAQKIEEQNQQTQADKDQAEQNVQDSQNASDQSQEDVEQTTSSLVDVIGVFFGAITGASPSNCNITLSFANYFSQDVNMCQLSPPPAITALLSIVVAFMVFGLAKSIISKIVTLFRSFQG